jgi:SAM-dependent methyltransferase
VAAAAPHDRVLWHDIECGSYRADLPLWRELAGGADGDVLDAGAGTGRVALELARAGHPVTAVDTDSELIAALRERAGELPVRPLVADVRELSGPERFGLVVAAMQLVQILDGPEGRARFLAAAHEHLRPGGIVGASLADPVPEIAPGRGELPLPDLCELDGWVYSSQPVAVRREGDATMIERRREAVSPDGARSAETDLVRLDPLSPGELEDEAQQLGFEPLERRRINATEEHVGSSVVLLRR